MGAISTNYNRENKMSTFTELLNTSSSQKVVLLEIDIGQKQEWWKNDSPFVYKINLDKNYPEILDPALQFGDVVINIQTVGSVREDQTNLLKLSTLASVKTTAGSFFFDSSLRTLYVHCTDDNEPQIHLMFIGAVFGFSNYPKDFNNIQYEPRIMSVSNITQSKDPLYFSRISFQSFSTDINNNDAAFDSFGEDNDIFGNSARLLIGFDDIDYDDYEQIASGYLENYDVNANMVSFGIQDDRKRLSTPIPPNVFDSTTYPDIKEENINKPIPLGYGTIFNAPVICTNEEETPTPANYDFKICDTTNRIINSIDAVYVEGVLKATVTTDLNNATFQLAAANYSPGDNVTVDFKGYEDDSGVLISNVMDIQKDILIEYASLVYNNDIFDVGQWDLATLNAPDAGYYINTFTKVSDTIERISNTAQLNIFIKQDGRYTAKKFNSNASPIDTIDINELLENNNIIYDSSQITTSTVVKYKTDWDDDKKTLQLVDVSQEETLFEQNKTKKRQEFETLLITSAEAQEFSDFVLELSGTIQKQSTILTKTQHVLKEIVDNITIPIIARATGATIGLANAEIIGKNIDVNNFTVSLTCRIYEILPETYNQSVEYWGSSYWGGTYWSDTSIVEVT